MSEKPKRKPAGRPWSKGQSGNPAGRPRGSINQATRLRKLIDVESIVVKLQAEALEGNIRAAELLLDRALPPLRSVAEPVALPGVAEAPNLTARADRIVELVAAGQISADIGTSLLSALGQFARITALDELIRRIEQLEQSHAIKPD